MSMLLSDMELIPSPLNYIGGKYKLLPQLLLLFPKINGTFIDLFCGGCNVGINVKSSRTVFNDTNADLINLYNTLKSLNKAVFFEMVDKIIEKYNLSCSDLNGYDYYGCDSSGGLGSYNKEHYIQMRKDFNNHTNSDCYYYAMLYVMIVYSFNNQIRFNREGKFNLPVGKRDYNANMQRKLSKFVDRIKNGNYVFTTMDFEKFD